jgi:hypothetical protein
LPGHSGSGRGITFKEQSAKGKGRIIFHLSFVTFHFPLFDIADHPA